MTEFFDPNSTTGWPVSWTMRVIPSPDPSHDFKPDDRVFHDERRTWGTVLDSEPGKGLTYVDEDTDTGSGRPIWLESAHLWTSDGTAPPEPGDAA